MQAVNEAGKKVNKAVTIGGKRQALTLTRMVFKLEPSTVWPPPPELLACDQAGPSSGAAAGKSGSAASAKAKGKGRKGKKGATAAVSAAAAAAAAASASTSKAGAALDEDGSGDAAAAAAAGLAGLAGAVRLSKEDVQATKGSSFETDAVWEPLANSGRFGAQPFAYHHSCHLVATSVFGLAPQPT